MGGPRRNCRTELSVAITVQPTLSRRLDPVGQGPLDPVVRPPSCWCFSIKSLYLELQEETKPTAPSKIVIQTCLSQTHYIVMVLPPYSHADIPFKFPTVIQGVLPICR